MTVLDTLKSLLGMESKDRRGGDEGAAGVTVEREPEPEPEPVSSPGGSTESTGTDGEGPDTGAEAATTDDESAGADEAPVADEPSGSEEPTDVLEGIGPTYAERLADAGVETVGDLATADAATLVDDVDNVSEGRLGSWIERANERTEA